jgi:hypothetical protein
VRLFTWVIILARAVLGAINFLETQLGKLRNRLLRRVVEVEQAPQVLSQPTQALAKGAIKETERLERQLARRRRGLLETLLFLERQWLDRLKAGSLIVGYNNIGEIRFHWAPENKEVIQRLWWRHPSNPDQPTLMTEYRATLELPERDAAPPLP